MKSVSYYTILWFGSFLIILNFVQFLFTQLMNFLENGAKINYLVPASPWYVDVPVRSHLLLKFGRLDNSLPRKITELNQYIRSFDIQFYWNGCNGMLVENPELSSDGTARNHSFINFMIKNGQYSKRNRISFQKYFEEKYNIKRAYPHIPLLRDSWTRMYSLEVIHARIEFYQ